MATKWTPRHRITAAVLGVLIVVASVMVVVLLVRNGNDQPASVPGLPAAAEATPTSTSVVVPKLPTTTAQTSVVVTTTALPPPPPPVPAAQPVSDFAVPQPNTASLAGAQSLTLFGGRISLPYPESWAGAKIDDGTEPEATFVDMSGCNASEDRCPHISFVDLASPVSIHTYGSNPVVWWKANSCSDYVTSRKAVEGPLAFTVGGVQGQFYRRHCTKDDTTFLWYFPGKKLFVLGEPGDAGGLSVEIIQGVLSQIKWK